MNRLVARTLATTALLGALVLPSAADAAFKVDGKPKISFFATGSPGFLDIEGVSDTATVTDDGTTLVFTVPWSSVKTGIDLRDDHMRNEYVQVAQYPDAKLSVPKASIQWGQSGTATADFTVHGVTKPVTVSYTTKQTSKGWKITGKFDLDASAHGIKIPSYLGVTVEPKMKAEVTMELADA